MTISEGVKNFKVKDVLLNGRLFEVTVRLSDQDVNCECKFYLRKGYLCRHAFASLHQCGVSKIPLSYVKMRWIKKAENHPSVIGSNVSAQHCVELDDVKLQVKENWFDFQSCMSIAGFDKAAVEMMRTHVQAMKVDMNEFLPHKNGNVDKFVGPKPHSHPVILNPNTSRNKGCGSRIKSGKEKAMDAYKDKRRKCSKCGEIAGHNVRSCPKNQK
ncbi:hypothetical protein POM88_043788 [Heracleum sosnowskyi]|uniref:SWIM-type domain-containing protein n=1 Tax=Heracleum sosnowskyi TaxID=360622 RepID=A0AAD8M4J7_9APIA|nr:hypothetical protein POM88_043788 [Heracleum sosnowskyi]